MEKKTYICPAQKVLKIETSRLLDISIVGGEGDQELSKGYSTDIWSKLDSDNIPSHEEEDE